MKFREVKVKETPATLPDRAGPETDDLDLFDLATYQRVAERMLSWQVGNMKYLVHPSKEDSEAWVFRCKERGKDTEEVVLISKNMFEGLEALYKQSNFLRELGTYLVPVGTKPTRLLDEISGHRFHQR